MSTARTLLGEGRERLKKAGIAEWEGDAWLLLEYAAGLTRSRFLSEPETEVPPEAGRHYGELIEKRGRHTPLQYLTGSQEFMGFPFLVNEDVLIPRQDTEILAEEALKFLRPGMEILDLCTGSGCILFSLLKLCPGTAGTGADLSEKALRMAERNREALAVDAQLVRSDLFEAVDGSFDLIVSNPPYIPTATYLTLMEEVREHEPRMALDGGEDGLYFYEEIIGKAPGYLKPHGMLLFEIGHDEAKAVCEKMRKRFADIRVVKDLSGLDRVVCGRIIDV